MATKKKQTSYPPEYRQRILDLYRSGRTIQELAAEFEPSGETIRLWVKQADLDSGARVDGLTSSEREELTKLRRENRVLREEREILKKAAALRRVAAHHYRAAQTATGGLARLLASETVLPRSRHSNS